ncbi:S-4TM family putative pore-forming effector [Psychrobacillus sp. FSL H8-0484]|uniref:S-4TM family putative pore-forming effector n=1 Tax=Psychrobacillus sp. FSL H8-0484 TaxID=2921390 RepID=UPI0030FCBB18
MNGKKFLEVISLNMDEIYINGKQNEPESLRLLAAMRILYGRAKILRSFRVFITVLLPIVSVLSLKYFSNFKEELAFIAGVWLVLNRIFFIEIEKSMVKDAAKIQEKFDVDLFQISWNNLLVGEKIPIERIMRLNEKSQEKEENLKNWYPGLKSPNHFFNVLLAQKTNIIWDIEQRKFYKNVLYWILILYILILLGTCFLMNLPTQTLIISFLVPSFPLILHLIETANGHKQRHESLEKVLPKVTADVENYSRTGDGIVNTSRGYQDIVFLKRCDVNMVPDKIYWLKRNLFDKIAKETNEAQSDIR